MNGELLIEKFEKMGARLQLNDNGNLPRNQRWRNSQSVSVNILNDQIGEYFHITVDPDVASVEIVDLRPQDRHLLLMARFANNGDKAKFLCGHDERHWFVAAVPDRRGVSNVMTAKESLKPVEVQNAQVQKGVKHKDKPNRKTKAYVRQGEWFFIPEPGFPDPDVVLRNEPLRRGSGKPHVCSLVTRTGGETVYACRQHPNGISPEKYGEILARNPRARGWGWRQMARNPRVYAKGSVRHPDHKTIHLGYWHRVVMNTEAEAPAMQHVAFLD